MGEEENAIDELMRTASVSVGVARSLANLGTSEWAEPSSEIIRRGRVCRQVYIVLEGAVRVFRSVEGEERNFWFGIEGDLLYSDAGIVMREASKETFEAIERCRLFRFDYDEMMERCATDFELFRWWNGMVHRELYNAVERLSAFTSMNATERYLQLLCEHPSIVQRIPLAHIASYLGVTPQSLSRIRANFAGKGSERGGWDNAD